jgi:folate-dependent phosphoribosylglycinamide formyltransferase PurN
MRIVLLAVDDEFAGEMQKFLYQSHPEWIVGSVISACKIYKHSDFEAAWMVFRKSGLIFLANMTYIKLLRYVLGKRNPAIPSDLARQHGVELYRSLDINDVEGVAKLRSWKPDLIISTNFSHYIGKTVRESIARYGCWNLHKSLLPEYRGMAPSFHALLEGRDKVGASLHLVAKGFDTGDVLSQVQVPVTKKDTVYDLNRKTSTAGGQMMASFLEGYDPQSTKAVPQPSGDWKNYTYPTREEVRAFRKKGLRFYRSDND